LRVRGDAARLEQIFVNLLSNAAKYTRRRRIRVTARAEKAEAVVSVATTASASRLTCSRMSSIFSRKRRPRLTARKAASASPHVVRSLTEMHGGRVAVESGGKSAGTTLSSASLSSPAHADRARRAPDPHPRAPWTRSGS